MGKWLYSGEQLKELERKNLFYSRKVQEFLTGERTFIILSAKGMGKTHLLRQKRKDLATSPEGSGAVFVPSSSGSDVDRQTSLPRNISQKALESISQEEWAALWEVAIGISALLNSHLDIDGNPDLVGRLMDIADDETVPDEVVQLVENKLGGGHGAFATPTFVLNSILATDTTSRQRLLKRAPNLIFQVYQKHIQSAVYIFIDSIDQTLTDTFARSVSLWVDGQMGLALAAYNVFVNCGHIKVYTSIRQEAWNKFAHQSKLAISSYCLELTYSKSELRQMLNQLCSYYEGRASISDLFEFSHAGCIKNARLSSPSTALTEDFFDYVYRHSLGTPRSLLHIMDSLCAEIDRDQEPEQLEKDVRREVNLKSGSLAQTKIESEMACFLTFLGSDMERLALFSSIHKNVLRKSDMNEINHSIGSGAAIHPFCELYNLGLIGVIREDIDGNLEQSFKKPMDFDWRLHECMPDSSYYLLHPSLEAYLSNKYKLQVEQDVLVSPGAPWPAEWNDLIQQRTVKVFISYKTEDVGIREQVTTAIDSVFLAASIRHETWVDDEQINSADSLPFKISEGIEWADFMVAIVTPSYLTSRWCMSELSAMTNLDLSGTGKRVFPFVFGGADRSKLGHLISTNLVPSIDEADAASVLEIGQTLRKFVQGKHVR